LKAAVPVFLVATGTSGSRNIAVFNSAPGGGSSKALSFMVDQPVPVLSSLSPTSATAGKPGFTLTANGSKFTAHSAVDWNGAALPYVSATKLTASVPAADIHVPGTANVTVYTSAPGAGTSSSVNPHHQILQM